MNKVDQDYCEFVERIMNKGSEINTRNSKVKRLFGQQLYFDSTPLISVRKTAWKNAIREWEWFMSGSNDLQDLHKDVHSWWEPFANKNKAFPFNYSIAFCDAGDENEHVDQINDLIVGVKDHPYSRRNLITSWIPAHIKTGLINPTNCHSTIIQVFIEPNETLHIVTYQRSADVICGLPHNLIQMAAFQLWLCKQSNKKIGSLTWIGGDCHVYEDHFDIAKRIIRIGEEENQQDWTPTPVLCYCATNEKFKADDFYLQGEYKPLIKTKAKMII